MVVTDNLVPFPCLPWQIQGNNVDVVVEVDSIGDPSKIVSGTTRVTQSPDRRRIAELAARFCAEAGIMRDGFSFQAGAGGTTLAFAIYLARADALGRGHGAIRPRRIQPVHGGDAPGGADRVHPRRSDLRPGRGRVHA